MNIDSITTIPDLAKFVQTRTEGLATKRDLEALRDEMKVMLKGNLSTEDKALVQKFLKLGASSDGWYAFYGDVEKPSAEDSQRILDLYAKFPEDEAFLVDGQNVMEDEESNVKAGLESFAAGGKSNPSAGTVRRPE